MTVFGIVLEDDVLFCSDEKKYNYFEIVIFIEKLLRSVNPRQFWRLNDIYLEEVSGLGIVKEQENGITNMSIKHLITANNKNLFYCLVAYYQVLGLNIHHRQRQRHGTLHNP